MNISDLLCLYYHTFSLPLSFDCKQDKICCSINWTQASRSYTNRQKKNKNHWLVILSNESQILNPIATFFTRALSHDCDWLFTCHAPIRWHLFIYSTAKVNLPLVWLLQTATIWLLMTQWWTPSLSFLQQSFKEETITFIFYQLYIHVHYVYQR